MDLLVNLIMVIILLCTCIKLSNYTSFKKIRLYNLEKKKNLSLNLRLKAGRQNLISLNCKFLINKTWTIKPVFIANINKEGSKDQVLHIINFFFLQSLTKVLGQINIFKLQLPHL